MDTAAAPPSAVQLRLTSTPHWQRGGQPPQPLATQDALMLAWLALEGATPRERLAAMLWPESSPEAARNTLRQRLFRLRRSVGADVVAGTAALALAEGVGHDLDADGPLLAGLGPAAEDGSTPLGAWLAQQRRTRGAHRRQTLLERIEALETRGDLAAALPLAEELQALDPLAEEGHRRIMRLHYLQGDRAAALRAFDRLEQQLKHEVGTTPGAETLALLQTLETESTPAGAEDIRRLASAQAQRPLPVAVLRPPRLIGREAELRLLRNRWWVSGTGLALVLGDAGMGKSRLLAALVDDITAAGTSAGHAPALASARPGDTMVPYSSLGRLLRSWGPAGREASAALAARDRQAVWALVPEWRPQPAPEPAATVAQDPAQAIAALLAAAAAAGTMATWILDDLHFADGATLALLPSLVQMREGTFRLAIGSRPPTPGTELDAALHTLAQAASDPLRLELSPLSTAQLAELVDSLGLAQARGDELAPLLRQHSGGNPLFALETLKAALKAGLGAGAWGLATALPKPESLRQLIQQQLARLSAPALMLARLAGVAGADFSLSLAAAVLEQHALQLADPWSELEAQQVLLEDGSFAHDLVFEAVLGTVPTLIVRHLHGRIAQSLEQSLEQSQARLAASAIPLHEADPAPEPARIAHHWEAAGQARRALPHWRAAAERAHHAWREEERIAFLLRAADIAEAAADRASAFDCVARAIDAHMDVLRDARGFALLDRLDGLAASDRERALAVSKRAWYHGQLAESPDHAEAARLGEVALQLAASAGDRELTELTRERLGTTLSLLGRFDEALAHLERVRPWAEQNFGADALASYHGNLAVVLDNLGRSEQALHHHHAALAASQALADRPQQITHQSNLAVNRLNVGDARAALAAAEAGQRIVADWDLAGGSVAFLHAVRMQAARALGSWRLARACAEQALEQLEQHHPARLPMVLLHRALLNLELGQHQAAAQDLQRIAAVAERLPPHLRARHALVQARWQFERGLDSRVACHEALALAPANGWPEVRLSARLQASRLEAPAQARSVAEAVSAEAQALGLQGSVLAAQLRLAETLPPDVGPANAGLARQVARRIAAAAELTVPTLRPRAEVWHGLFMAWRAAGEVGAAVEAARAGRQWLEERLADELDTEAEREAATQRCPAHRALMLDGGI